jgi:hypothetical protein
MEYCFGYDSQKTKPQLEIRCMAQDPIHSLWVAIADATGYDINSNEVKALARYLNSRWLPLAKSALEAGTSATIKTYFEGHRIVDTSSAVSQHHPEPE